MNTPTSEPAVPSFSRRHLVRSSAALLALGALAPAASACTSAPRWRGSGPVRHGDGADGPFQLMELPYPDDALEPVISAHTISFHHDKHHRAYLDNMNRAIAGTPHAGQSLEAIVRAAAADPAKRGLFNNAAQVWNHDFYWLSMDPDGGGKPSGDLLEAIERDFDDFESFAEEFARVSTTQFASGWGWLVADEAGKLSVMSTSNADLPMLHGKRALLTIDVWEHAYYLDHQNRRAEYVRECIDKLANWEFAAANLAS
jgi:superoxide dismutase, Fe-Mn family